MLRTPPLRPARHWMSKKCRSRRPWGWNRPFRSVTPAPTSSCTTSVRRARDAPAQGAGLGLGGPCTGPRASPRAACLPDTFREVNGAGVQGVRGSQGVSVPMHPAGLRAQGPQERVGRVAGAALEPRFGLGTWSGSRPRPGAERGHRQRRSAAQREGRLHRAGKPDGRGRRTPRSRPVRGPGPGGSAEPVLGGGVRQAVPPSLRRGPRGVGIVPAYAQPMASQTAWPTCSVEAGSPAGFKSAVTRPPASTWLTAASMAAASSASPKL